jgi:tetratricopeptide (TPR) repeat protein
MTRALSVAEIRASLDDALDVLDHGPVDAPSRHRGVRAVLEPSWALLDDAERDALLRLAEFRTSFQFDAAAAVGGVSLPLLLRLVDHALLRSEGSGRGRFGFHPVMLAFLPDVMHAVRAWFAAGDDARAIDMMRALVVDAEFLVARGGGVELIALARQAALAAEARGDLHAAEPLWTKVANAVRLLQDDLFEAVACYARALELAERSGEVGRQVMLHAILGAILDAQLPDVAEAHMTKAGDLAEAADDDLLRCEVLHRRGYVASAREDWPRARTLNAQAIEVADRLWAAGAHPGRVPSLLFFSLHNLGVAEEGLGDVAASIPHRTRALEVATARGQSLWIANARHDLAIAYRALDDRDAARRHAEEALRLYDLQGAAMNRARVQEMLRSWAEEEVSHDEVTG